MPFIQLQHRRGLASEWTDTNPTLADGEFAFETDTRKMKIGNGATQWNSLAYAGLQGPIGPTGPSDGPIGPAGLSGTATNTGATGPIGSLGPTGPTGPIPTSVVDFAVTGTLSTAEIQETVNTITSPGTFSALDWSTGSIFYISSMASNFTINITNIPTTTNKSYVVTLILDQGVTGYYANVLQIASAVVPIYWVNAITPIALATRKEIQSITLYYTSSLGWTAFGELASFG